MKRIVQIAFIVSIVLALFSAIYMEVNLHSGIPYEFPPHELTEEVLDAIQAKDFFYVPFWFLMLSGTMYVISKLFGLFGSEHTYYSTTRFFCMMALYAAALFSMFNTFDIIGKAQLVTNKTAAFTYGFFDIMEPFMIVMSFMVLAEGIKLYNKRFGLKNKGQIARFETLKQVIKDH